MSWNSQAYGHRQYPTMHTAAKHIVGNVMSLGACAPCQAQAQLGAAGPPHYHRIQYPDGQWGRTQKDYLTGLGSARVWYLGQSANGYTGPGFSMKSDITAGVAAFVLPLSYHLWAPKKWKRLNPIMNIAAVIATYIGVVWVMPKA